MQLRVRPPAGDDQACVRALAIVRVIAWLVVCGLVVLVWYVARQG